jgi:hypothetical protein
MIKIYEEIHHAGMGKLRQNPLYDIHLFLFKARVCRFFDLLSDGVRDSLRDQPFAHDENDMRCGVAAWQAKIALNFPEPERLKEFCADPNLLLLTICAHSKSFRDALKRSDADSRQEGEPTWSDVYPTIKSCASSLELFARSYHFDWFSSLHKFDPHFKLILDWVYTQETQAGGALEGKTMANLSIAEGDLVEIHQMPDGQGSKIHHHWALPIEDRELAVRPSIEYTVTTDMARAPFVRDFYAVIDRPRKGALVQPRPPVQLSPGSKQTLQQLEITK